MFNDLAPTYLQELLVPKITYTHLRSANDVYSLHTTIPQTKYGQNAFTYAAPAVWNELPCDIRLCPTLDTFKKHLKSLYFVEYFGAD